MSSTTKTIGPLGNQDMTTSIDLLSDSGPPQSGGSYLQRVYLGEDEALVIPFTSTAEPIRLHYVEDEGLGYVPCGGPGCVPCAAGFHFTEHVQLPVYNPASGKVEVLVATTAMRPGSLLPQVKAVLKAAKPVVMIVKREGKKFTVATADIPADADHGETAIAAFTKALAEGSVTMASAFPAYDADLLKNLPSVATKLKFKGLA